MSAEQISITARMVERGYTLFAPKGKQDLRRDYPELWDYQEIKQLSGQEMLFVWYMRCVSSPFTSYEDADKLDACLAMAYPDPKDRQAKRSAFVGGKYPTKIKAAMERMAAFQLGPRVSAMMMVEKRISDIRTLISMDMGKAIREYFNESAKDYHAAVRACTAELSDLVRQSEAGSFGVSEQVAQVPEGILRDFHKQRA